MQASRPAPLGPPQILLLNPATTPSPHKTFEPNIYPNLGLLVLGTTLRRELERRGIEAQVLYCDGSLVGDAFIRDYIADNADRLAVIGYSAYTLNYGSCVSLASHAKACNGAIVNIIGNDHFSALYTEILTRRRDEFDFGFYGNDIVESFADFVIGILSGDLRDLETYPGLCFRDPRSQSGVTRCPENPAEFSRLPLPDYALLDSLTPHTELYQREQLSFYPYARENGLRMTVVEIARGCLKFAGKRNESGIPLNACDFCAIIPGVSAMSAQDATRAWETIRNAFEHGYNYLFITADEFSTTFWPLIKAMIEQQPDWYLRLPPSQRPRLMCYARADAFRDRLQNRIDMVMNGLGVDHFFVGLDGFSTLSLRAMNKGVNARANDVDDLLHHNLAACREIARRGGRLSSGAVITHLGITPETLETNYRMMREILETYPQLFVEIDFELLCPVPGSLAFDYIRKPGMARARADALGLNVDDRRLEMLHAKYLGRDDPDPQELAEDFILGCCPDITVEMAHVYLDRVRRMAAEAGIAYDCSNIGEPETV